MRYDVFLMFQSIVELMLFVPDRRAAAKWYATLLDRPLSTGDDPDHLFIALPHQQIWFHQADAKSPSGRGGQVAYWQVEDLSAAMARADAAGAALYRGPLDREDGTHMCQFADPFGNVFGMIGPLSRKEEAQP